MSRAILGVLRPSPAEPVDDAVRWSIAVAWAALVVHDLGPTHDHHRVGDIAAWLVMVIAMMGPAVLPAVRHVVESSLRWRRPRAAAEFLSVYVGAWLLVGLITLATAARFGRSLVTAAFALAVAAVWQGTSYKWRAMV